MHGLPSSEKMITPETVPSQNQDTLQSPNYVRSLSFAKMSSSACSRRPLKILLEEYCNTTGSVCNWSVQDVANFVIQTEMLDYARLFSDNVSFGLALSVNDFTYLLN